MRRLWAAVQEAVVTAAKQEVVKSLKSQSGFGRLLLEQMAHAHPTPGSANDSSTQR